jgi:hypothetical protein
VIQKRCPVPRNQLAQPGHLDSSTIPLPDRCCCTDSGFFTDAIIIITEFRHKRIEPLQHGWVSSRFFKSH